MNIYEAFCQRVDLSAGTVAIVDEKIGASCDYAELKVRVDELASSLSYLGIQSGDKVLLFVPMSLELYILLLALFKMGACVVFIDPSQGSDFVNRCAKKIEPDVFIGVPKAYLFFLSAPYLRQIPRRLCTKKIPFIPSIWQKTSDNVSHKVNAIDAALITFTSGSTGEPKAIVRSHQFLLNQYQVLKTHVHLEADKVDLSGLPVFVLANLFAGVSSVIANTRLSHPKKIDPLMLNNAIVKHNITRVGGSPALYERLLLSDMKKLNSLRALYMGGAPVMPKLLARLKKALPMSEQFVIYGSSEAEPIASYAYSTLRPQNLQKMQDGAGLFAGDIVDEIRLEILDTDAKPCATNEIGEITVSGKHVVQSYLDTKDNHNIKIEKDNQVWHRSGDSGYVDEDGALWLVGRTSAVIEDKKGVVYPFCVEVAASEIVENRVALLARANKRVLFIEGVNIEGVKNVDIELLLVEKLAWALIDEWVFISKMPLDKRHNAKIDYTLLRKL